MRPLEKAQELVNKMFKCDQYTPEESMAMLYPHALECALIAVDEILASKPNEVYKIYSTWIPASTYWRSVKQEIEYMKLKSLPK